MFKNLLQTFDFLKTFFFTEVMLLGGYRIAKSAYLFVNSTYLFSKSRNLWILFYAKASSIRYGHGSLTIKNECYVFGGTMNKNVDKYKHETNEFVTLNLMDKERSFFGYSSFEKKSFIIAGGYYGQKITNACFIYNVTSNTFEQKGSLNAKKNKFSFSKLQGCNLRNRWF